MKAELTRDGYRKVTAENITEAWALNTVQPVADNPDSQGKFIVDCSILLFPEEFTNSGSSTVQYGK